jgi:hypothetical protein
MRSSFMLAQIIDLRRRHENGTDAFRNPIRYPHQYDTVSYRKFRSVTGRRAAVR